MAGDEPPQKIFQDLASSIDLWLVPLANDASGTAGREKWLSADERQRAAAATALPFGIRHPDPKLRERDRSRKTSYYINQRLILADYLDQAPADVRIERGRGGKPFVPGGVLSFNASDANLRDQAFGVVAVHKPPKGTPIYDLGVDIQADPPRLLSALIALTAASPTEQGELLWQPKGQLRSAITSFWTRKEAVVKATGVGLAAIRATVTEPILNPIDNPDPEAVRSWRWVGGRPRGQVRAIHRDEVPAGFSVALAWKPRRPGSAPGT